MRKRSRRRVHPCSAPMLVNRGIHNTELSMVEEMYVEAFAGGWATKEHFDGLVDMLNVLTLAGSYKEAKDRSLAAICEAMRIPLWNIRQLIIYNGNVVICERRREHPTFEDSFKSHWYWDYPTDDGQDWGRDEVTHWMPLPPPPAGVTK